MNISKTNEILGEIVHLASAAILITDEAVKRQALGDIAAAIASVCPIDYASVASTPSSTHPPVCGKGVDRGAAFRVAKTPQTVVFDITLSTGRKVSAELEAEATDHQTQAFLYDGEKPVCQITFFNQYQSRSYSYKIVRKALNGLMSKVGHNRRVRANRKASGAGRAGNVSAETRGEGQEAGS